VAYDGEMRVGVVVLAGGTVDAGLAAVLGTDRKAEARVGDRMSRDWVRLAAEEAGYECVVVGRPGSAPGVVAEGETATDNMIRGADALPFADLYLMIPADSPFVTADDFRNFAEFCRQKMPFGRPFCALGVCPAEDFAREFPDAPATPTRTLEGPFLAGALYGCNRLGLDRSQQIIRDARRNRKQILRLALRLGLPTLLSVAMGRVSLPDIERKLGSLIDGELAIWRGASARSVMDFDDAAEWASVQRHAARLLPTLGEEPS
jgi:hypothetical protein